MTVEMIRCLLACGAFTTGAVACAQNQFEILVFAQPEKWHKDAVPVAHQSFIALAQQHQFGLNWSEDPAVFEGGDLSKFAAIVFVNCTGEALNENQRAAFAARLHGGAGFVAVHAAAATKQGWPWYDRLIGRVFRIHPYVQTGVIHVVDRGFPACFHLPESWVWTDEWYEFEAPLVADLHDVLIVDETTYDPHKIWPGQQAAGMGAHHPSAWYHVFEGSRVFVTALGHQPIHYTDPRFLDHVYGGIYWAATGRGVAPGPAN